MLIQALIYPHPAALSPPLWLERACREADFEVSSRSDLPPLEGFGACLPEHPTVIFLPAVEEDCLGIKLAQLVRVHVSGHLVHLYADGLPQAAYMATAVREGVSEVLDSSSEHDLIERQLRRARTEARETWSARERLAHQSIEVEQLRRRLEAQLKRQHHHEERWIALAQVACRMASGELRVHDTRAKLLIVSASDARSQRVHEVAQRLGFDVTRAPSGAAASSLLGVLKPLVILCDGELPDMEARVFANKAREDLGRHHVSVVVWSSSPEADERFLAPGSGVDHVVHKTSSAPDLELGAALLATLVS